jgi:hypothetical protein
LSITLLTGMTVISLHTAMASDFSVTWQFYHWEQPFFVTYQTPRPQTNVILINSAVFRLFKNNLYKIFVRHVNCVSNVSHSFSELDIWCMHNWMSTKKVPF